MIAQKLEEIDFTLDNKALNEENYSVYYVPTKEGRGEDPTATLIRKMNNLGDKKNYKVLFSGFKGCGKSTELLRLKLDLQDDFVIRIFSVRERLDPNNMSISEILIAIMTDLFHFVEDNYKKIILSDKLLENLENWTSSIYKEETQYRDYGVEAQARIGLKSKFLGILKAMARLDADFRSGRKYSEITKKEVRQTLSELIINCNLLLREIKSQLTKIKKKNIIFIIEDLEKIDLIMAEELFYNYAGQMTAIDCSAIYTFPISLVFNPRYTVIINEFDENFTLPMIKVHDKSGADYAPGIGSIEHILEKRVRPGLIPANIGGDFIRKSGGCLRDLFRMIKLAASNAIDRGLMAVDEQDYRYGVNKLKSDYFNAISYNEQRKLDAQHYYDILARCCKSPDKKPVDVEGMMDLKHNLCILGYNTDSWFDVHPLVKDLLKEKNLV